jgi:hypothetical protein
MQCPDGCCTRCFDENGNSDGSPAPTPAPDGMPSSPSAPSMPSMPSSPVAPAPTASPPCGGLTEDDRARELVAEIIGKVGSENFGDSTTPQFQATDWLINKDARNLCPGDDSVTQRYAAATLYYAMNGDNWDRCAADNSSSNNSVCPLNNRWLSPDSECFWNGVTCDDEEEIQSIVVTANNLRGFIPNDLEILAQDLENLDLSENSITGSIPSVMGTFQNLQALRLDMNQLSGVIPVELANLADLRRLELNGNFLSGTIASEFGLLRKLRTLSLDNNTLTGNIPASLGQLSELGKYIDRRVQHNIMYCLASSENVLLEGNCIIPPPAAAVPCIICTHIMSCFCTSLICY